MNITEAYESKPDGYYAGIRQDYLHELAEESPARVLEIGCGSGDLGAEVLKSGISQEYCGVELFPEAASVASAQLTQVCTGDVETMEMPWEHQSFNALVASEVLEHLRDPWAVLRQLHSYLKPGALVLASSPNVANKRVISML